MDFEKRARRQSFRVIVSETIMVLTVIIMVAVLALVVSGYWLNGDFKVERQGMLQISSVPTGASVAVDGDAPWYQRTNTSKVLSSGEHQITLTKDGYDSWSKTVNISEGLLYRLHYPRLFLKEREKEHVYQTVSATFATVSKDSTRILLTDNTTTWTLLDLTRDNLDPKTIDIAPFFTSISLAEGATTGLFTGAILSTAWSRDGDRVLIQSQSNDTTEWILLDTRNPKNSVNLTREFALDFTDVRIFDNSASNFLALRSGNLYKIDLSARQLSDPLATNVESYNFYDQEIVFFGQNQINLLKIGDAEPTIFKDFTTANTVDGALTDLAATYQGNQTTAVHLSRFYESKYITFIRDNNLIVYKYDDGSEFASRTIGFTPETTKIGQSGDFVFLNQGTLVATLDMESRALTEWSLDSAHFGWLDGSMLYAVTDGVLSVYDYDGLNHRNLSTNVSNHFPVAITNNKWLYYFSDNEIIREIIVR